MFYWFFCSFTSSFSHSRAWDDEDSIDVISLLYSCLVFRWMYRIIHLSQYEKRASKREDGNLRGSPHEWLLHGGKHSESFHYGDIWCYSTHLPTPPPSKSFFDLYSNWGRREGVMQPNLRGLYAFSFMILMLVVVSICSKAWISIWLICLFHPDNKLLFSL